MAEAFNIPMCPHSMLFDVLFGVISAHCVAATPNGMIVECLDLIPFHNTTITKFQEETGHQFMPNINRPVKGWIELPKVPGLGIDPDLEAIEECRKK